MCSEYYEPSYDSPKITPFEEIDEQLNDAQCRYVMYLVKGNLTIGETGRLFRSRKPALARVWTRSLFDLFMEPEVPSFYTKV